VDNNHLATGDAVKRFKTKTSIKTTIKNIIYTFMNRITTNMTLHNVFFAVLDAQR